MGDCDLTGGGGALLEGYTGIAMDCNLLTILLSQRD